MKLSYSPVEIDNETKRTAEKIVNLLIESNLTYQKSIQALEAAQMLLGYTRPTK